MNIKIIVKYHSVENLLYIKDICNNIIREMEIKTTISYYIICIRMTVIRKTDIITSVGKNVEKLEP